MNEKLNRQGLILAIEEKELDLFFRGDGIYMLGDNPYLPVSRLLNIEPAMLAVYSYYNEFPEKRVDLAIEEELLRWLHWDSAEDVFAVFSLLSYQMKNEKNGESPFELNKDKIITKLRESCETYKDELMKLKKYEGQSCECGLWEVMQRENTSNIEKYGVEIL